MKPAQIAVICIAAVSAIALALVVRAMGASKPEPAQVTATVQAEPVAQVLVAAKNLEPGQKLTDADLAWKAWPAKDLNPLFITDGTTPAAPVEPAKGVEGAVAKAAEAADKVMTTGAKQDFIGAVVREPILAGEPIVNRKIVRAGDSGYMAAYLEPGMRAMAMRVSVETAAGGFILPGDRVDVILTREVKTTGPNNQSSSYNVANTIMRNLKVLAIDQATRAAEDEKAVIGATATLAVTGADAETLALARSQGDLSLVLRSYADTAGPSGRVPGAVRTGATSGGGASAGAAASGQPGRTVTIYREGQPEVVTVR